MLKNPEVSRLQIMAQSGFTLVEITVSLVIVSIASLALAAMIYRMNKGISATRLVLSRDAVMNSVRYSGGNTVSLKKSYQAGGNSEFKDCLNGVTCPNGATVDFDLYDASGVKIAGGGAASNWVYYKVDGTICQPAAFAVLPSRHCPLAAQSQFHASCAGAAGVNCAVDRTHITVVYNIVQAFDFQDPANPPDVRAGAGARLLPVRGFAASVGIPSILAAAG